MVERLREILHPATLAQVSYLHPLDLRERVLTLPVMMGLVLGLLWRQVAGVAELVRIVNRETVLWVAPLRDLTQQALSQRLRSLPAELFERVHRFAIRQYSTKTAWTMATNSVRVRAASSVCRQPIR